VFASNNNDMMRPMNGICEINVECAGILVCVCVCVYKDIMQMKCQIKEEKVLVFDCCMRTSIRQLGGITSLVRLKLMHLKVRERDVSSIIRLN